MHAARRHALAPPLLVRAPRRALRLVHRLARRRVARGRETRRRLLLAREQASQVCAKLGPQLLRLEHALHAPHLRVTRLPPLLVQHRL